jgi:hypothetical protein
MAGAAAGTTRDGHVRTTTSVVGMRTRDFPCSAGRVMSGGCPNNPKKLAVLSENRNNRNLPLLVARFGEFDITWHARDRDGAASALCSLRRPSAFPPSRTPAVGPLGFGANGASRMARRGAKCPCGRLSIQVKGFP